MRAVLLDGSEPRDRSLARVRESIAEALSGIGWQVQILPLARMEIAPCRGCLSCWTETPGMCAIEDQGREVLSAVCASHLAVFLSPVAFGGFDPLLKRALDRLMGMVSPFVERKNGKFRNKARYRRNPDILGVGLLSSPDGEAQRLFCAMVSELAFGLHAKKHGALALSSRLSPASTADQVRSALAMMGIIKR